MKITENTFRNLTKQTNDWTAKVGIFGGNGLSQSSIDHNKFVNIQANGSTRPDGTINSIGDLSVGVFLYGLDQTAISYNTFDTVTQGIKVCFTQSYDSRDVLISHNTFDKIHRMGMELQDANGCGHKNTITPTTNLVIEYNDIHINNDPYWDSFGISVAMPPVQKPIVRYNRIVGEKPVALNVPGIGIEAGGQSAQTYNNTVMGWYGLAIGIFGGSANVEYHDNYACSLGGTEMKIGDEHGSTPNAQLWNNTSLSSCPESGVPNPIKNREATTAAAAVTDGVYAVVNQRSQMVLDSPGYSVSSGRQMIQWPANGGDNQRWKFTVNSDGQYTITNVHSGLLLTDVNGKVQQSLANNSANQLWTVTPNNGAYSIKNVATQKVIDNGGNSMDAGNPVITWSANNGTNQNWTLQ